MDTAAAIASGFTLSPVLFLSHSGQSGNAGTYLQDVWTKGWTEVTFDLSAYRGRTVSLTFEASNCVPGAHFAYAYVALRNSCAGLEISGSPVACINGTLEYSVPALANATYNWTVPAGWNIVSGANTNIIKVDVGNNGGMITVHEVNSCADLRDTLNVTTSPPTVAGQVNSNNTVCSGINSTTLTLNGAVGNVINWISSTDGVNWTSVLNNDITHTAQDLTLTTQFAAIVQNGRTCKVDTSTTATITVDPRSVGGVISPDNMNFCAGQSTNSLLTLSGNVGNVTNWQVSNDAINWNNFLPANTNSFYNVNSINTTTYYRSVVKSGVCPADTSAFAAIHYFNTPYPVASINPSDVSICWGTSTAVNATINIGTSYTWSNANTLQNQGSGNVNTVPYNINATASPPATMDYVLTVTNAGCPNLLVDTFHVNVLPRIIVFAGNDTSIVVGQLLQLNATTNTPTANNFNWSPGTGLNFTTISNPVASLGPELGDYITYVVRATDSIGCYAEDNIKVTIFKTGPDIFVPSAFTPNGDGKNDIVKPICVGIAQLNYFKIFNRWGQLVFNSSQIGKGWDGNIGGTRQSTGNFVYMAQGIDYTGKTIFRKGNVVLIR
ncbi:MAG: gliding motility-associated C-terminal domain-containing protein [Bacteroidetes bacterium]|nr:gliding motility-associated C-terminal domain-containing protein [Bacteroidota bacterium]